MDWREFRDGREGVGTLVVAVERGQLGGGGRRRGRVRPGVTGALSSLEDRIGLRLVDRTTRRLAPTEAGSALAERARAWLAGYEDLLVGASQAPIRGVLRITAPVQFGRRHVVPIVSAFLNQYPDMRVELSLND